MKAIRGYDDPRRLTRGPGMLCQALQIDRRCDGIHLTDHQEIVIALNSLSFQYRWLSFLCGLTLSVVAAIIGGAICIALININGILPTIVTLGLPVAFVVFHFAWLWPKHLEPRLDKAQGTRWWQLYEQHWRERIFRYIQSCSEPSAVALERVVSMGPVAQQDDWAGLVKRFATNDIGLLIFCQTQAFVV
jgi:hypothetical protein